MVDFTVHFIHFVTYILQQMPTKMSNGMHVRSLGIYKQPQIIIHFITVNARGTMLQAGRSQV
jgi:hypothetical protein